MPSPAAATISGKLPRYDHRRSYEWNYDHAPPPVEMPIPAVPGSWQLCGLPVSSPLGVPAGPLLNGAWCLYYASLGFDVVTYKTVRSAARPCYAWPNLVPVECGQLSADRQSLVAATGERSSWAVSYGMPSKEPAVWRADVERTRDALPAGKLLSVSVVGTPERHETLAELADDYAQCARWAVESGADLVETNFSCPNVATCDGQLYQQPAAAAEVAERVRAVLGGRPLIVKIGFLPDDHLASALVTTLAPHVNGLAMTNSIAAQVNSPGGEPLFEGTQRGICGEAIRTASIEQVRRFRRIASELHCDLQMIGVGGAASLQDVKSYLAAGAAGVHLATAAIQRPDVAISIRREWSASRPASGGVAHP